MSNLVERLNKYAKHTMYCGWTGDLYEDQGCTCGLDKCIEEIMGITDATYIMYNFKTDKFFLQRGRETFYDEDRAVREWDTEDEARAWAVSNLGVDPAYDPSASRNRKSKKKEAITDDKQPELFS